MVTLRVQQSQGVVSSESPEPEDNIIALHHRIQGQVGLERLVEEPWNSYSTAIKYMKFIKNLSL